MTVRYQAALHADAVAFILHFTAANAIPKEMIACFLSG
ncbi:hypothetical protein YpB42003004_2275 [Yersinia pestis biovar Antiqua str. B42003004]|uniref:Uncharacterized protein n=1 Tax=Yersinia pestis biovar Orientalis str. IP275 TaxID=373665 RepID=A0AAV3BMW1_YERPE|nr:hypothetical protein YPIP275_4793 [Yersinia pestis biovar Orientalis str. IP275]EDR40633.1 hypothetical protein YpF1991016_0423 [Yersinia pestis biovar Orientalis str. F1991016]EDR51743.1 hypothetical protein YpB42003004_2275 [Yersinia pestis biovar Antiqua str. B42003004]EDR58684.1 hypothetical protein YpMG051020_0672 [Yersinia pestis biovar Orientalis str. MG05-1020]